MKLASWRALSLRDGILREPSADEDRLVLWLPGNQDRDYRYWERVGTVPRAEVSVADGICAIPAKSIQARQAVHGLFGKLMQRFRGSEGGRTLLLPNGEVTEQCGERHDDLLLVWPQDESGSLDEARIKTRWPDVRRLEQLGRNLFLIGVPEAEPETPAAPLDVSQFECPREKAKHLAALARAKGERRNEAFALTDLGIITLRGGDAQGAVTLHEQALAIARELGDQGLEGDVVGNLGMATLSAGQPRRALELFNQQLAYARAAGDRFMEKTALNSLGTLYGLDRDMSAPPGAQRARGAPQAIAFLEQALDVARAVADRNHEAELLWALGIQHAELGDREQASARAGEAIDIFTAIGKPKTSLYVEHLQRYRAGETMIWSRDGTANGSSTFGGASGWEAPPAPAPAAGQTVSGPGLLRLAITAASSMARFVTSGFKTVSKARHEGRVQTCATCEHHTGLRCRLCGCFTSAKAWLAHEDCPIKKWPR